MRTTQTHRGPTTRQGFTLIELIVVLGIIAVLASLVAGGVMRFYNAQRQSNTEATITILNGSLRKQWAAVIKQHAADDIPSGIIAMAGGPTEMARARVIWIKYQLKLNFPTSVSEAVVLSPTTGPFPALDAGGNANPFMANVPLTSPYRTDMNTFGFNNQTTSSAFLLLALGRKRGGALLNIDDMGAGALADANGTGQRQFIDGWGNPLKFDRWPTPGGIPDPIVGELDDLFPGKKSAVYRDPLDPQGLLMNPTWNNAGTVSNPTQGAYWFEVIFHPIHTQPNWPVHGTGNPFQQSWNMVPVISSAGPNGFEAGVPNNGYGDDDDIWGFRLRAGAKGDQ